jgi:hypothetical protein
MKKFIQLVNEIKMSDSEEARSVAYSGKRATNLLKHSWAQHDVSKEKKTAGDVEGAAKAASTGSRAHKLYLKAQKQHQARTPEQHNARASQMMSGASQDYKDQEKKRGVGHVRDSVELSGPAINEISKQLRDRYVERAVTAHGGYNMARRNTTGKDQEYFARKEANTKKGIARALSDHRLAKEEVEQVNEISKELANRYMHSAIADRRNIDRKTLKLQAKQSGGDKFFVNHKKISKLLAKSDKRTTGISRALSTITKEESDVCHVCGQTPCNCTHIAEVSKKALGSYIEKAVADKETAATASSFVAGRHGKQVYNDASESPREQKRAVGIKKALTRLTKEENELQSKENINELKVSTLLRYTTKANRSATKLGGDAARARDSGDMESWAKKANKADVREKGIRVATFKMHKQLNKGK